MESFPLMRFRGFFMVIFTFRSRFQAGSIFFSMFAAVAMVGVLGVAAISLLKGPVRAMNEITRRTMAENNMIAAGKLAIVISDSQTGDCDEDGAVEPLEWIAPGGAPAPANGGLLPPTIGASLQDPWGNAYGYCAWDHGAQRMTLSCGNSPGRLKGSVNRDNIVLAVLSSGPDRVFQTSCHEEGMGAYVDKLSGSDDIVLSYTYAEAAILSGGLWKMKENDSKTAEIQKNLSIKDSTGVEQLSFNTQSKQLAIGVGGVGAMPKLKADFIEPLLGTTVEFLSSVKMNGNNKLSVTNTANNDIGIEVLAGGTNAIGLKATGTTKAIESNGIIDMMNNKIVKLATPTADTDAATKKYVDDALAGTTQVTKCESFVFTSCSGSSSQNLSTTNLGACKKACAAANVQCCEAEFAGLPGNPNAALAACKGYNAPSTTSGGVRNILTLLLGGGKMVSALCYLE